MIDGLAGKTIAVTGATGFIGGAVVERLAATNCTILRVSRREPPPLLGRVMATVIDLRGDYADRVLWDQLANASVILHFAAQTSAALADEQPEHDFRSNVMPMRQLLASCREHGHRPTVIFSATVTQTGAAPRLAVNEDVPDQPLTVYDRDKLIAEQDLKIAAIDGVICGVSLRLPNIYGPGAHARSGDRDVLNRMIRAAMRGDTLTVYGAGDYVRDYLFIDDAVNAFLTAAACPERLTAKHFVVATGRGHTIRQAFELIAARVEAKCGRRVTLTADADRALTAIDRRHFIGDASRFTAATGWKAACDLAEGIDRTIDAYRCES